jgi:hypothetical protein
MISKLFVSMMIVFSLLNDANACIVYENDLYSIDNKDNMILKGTINTHRLQERRCPQPSNRPRRNNLILK